MGAGAGELLQQIHALAPDLALTAIELRPRPTGLPERIRWQAEADVRLTGLVVANELLDNIPCEVVELDASMVVRVVEVAQAGREQRLGAAADADQLAWLNRWWPLTEPGQRAEVGAPRDEAWASICSRVDTGLVLAIDYGHLRDCRPPTDTLTSYHRGRQSAVRLDGTRDVTSSVALDSVAKAVGADISTQRDMLGELGLDANRPPLSMATDDPRGYVRALALASQAAELTQTPGLGTFGWLLASRPPAVHLVDEPAMISGRATTCPPAVGAWQS